MCQSFDAFWKQYIDGVTAGATAFNRREEHFRLGDTKSPAYRSACEAEHAAHVQVQQARAEIEAHKRTCPACRHMMTARMPARKDTRVVDDAEFFEPPLLAMMEAV